MSYRITSEIIHHICNCLQRLLFLIHRDLKDRGAENAEEIIGHLEETFSTFNRFKRFYESERTGYYHDDS